MEDRLNMKVKICGITNREAAMAAVDAGADFIGFVFADSKRKVSPSQAKEMAETIPRTVKKVGVFVNESLETMNKISTLVGLDYIQLHGDETAQLAAAVNRPIIKALSIQNHVETEHYPCDYFLLDSPAGAYRGGNGVSFDWSLIQSHPIKKEKLILAGGLNGQNVKEAIFTVKPAIVDVSSGVETDGEKDPIKIKEFVEAAKLAFKNLKESDDR